MDDSLSSVSWPDIINLLSELVVFEEYDFHEFLKKLIVILGKIVPVDSCLIYFHDRDKKHSTLIASSKPHKKELGNITMVDGEGITGWVAEHQQTVAIEELAYQDKRFKFFKQLPEDKFEAFLSVPIFDGVGVVGVVNFQNRLPYIFSNEQRRVIEAIGKLIASAFSKTLIDRKLIDLSEKLTERKVIEKAKGVLMKMRGLSENEAFSLLRKEAMNKRKSMKEISEAILLVLDK